MIAAISNEVRIATPTLPAALSLVQAGKLRALAVMSPARLAVLPEVPTVAELGYPKATVLGWVGLHAPAATPPAILSLLETAVINALQDHDLRKRLVARGADVAPASSVTYGTLVADETVRWKQVVQAAGIPPQ
jgi:tripartite-type tricarboxylate transporter receptor subunit TctC